MENDFIEDFKKTWSDFKKASKDLFFVRPLNNQVINSFNALENKYQNIDLKINLMQKAVVMNVVMVYVDLSGSDCAEKDFCLASYDQNTKMMQCYLDSKTKYFDAKKLREYANAIADFTNIISAVFDN